VDVRALEQTCGSFGVRLRPPAGDVPARTLDDTANGDDLLRAEGPSRDGGAEETRTPDFLLAKEALYQLSYGPQSRSPAQAYRLGVVRGIHRRLPAVGVCGLEPQTSALSGQCSNQLS
jgi:hypothetical protein